MARKNRTRTRAEAKKLMWEYYSENKASLPKWIRECRESLIKEIELGTTVKLAFDLSIQTVSGL